MSDEEGKERLGAYSAHVSKTQEDFRKSGVFVTKEAVQDMIGWGGEFIWCEGMTEPIKREKRPGRQDPLMLTPEDVEAIKGRLEKEEALPAHDDRKVVIDPKYYTGVPPKYYAGVPPKFVVARFPDGTAAYSD